MEKWRRPWVGLILLIASSPLLAQTSLAQKEKEHPALTLVKTVIEKARNGDYKTVKALIAPAQVSEKLEETRARLSAIQVWVEEMLIFEESRPINSNLREAKFTFPDKLAKNEPRQVIIVHLILGKPSPTGKKEVVFTFICQQVGKDWQLFSVSSDPLPAYLAGNSFCASPVGFEPTA